jgi:hypothetical protein
MPHHSATKESTKLFLYALINRKNSYCGFQPLSGECMDILQMKLQEGLAHMVSLRPRIANAPTE